MEAIEGKHFTTAKGYQVRFLFKLIPSDMKWASTFSGELSNAAEYFSPFANVCQANKNTLFGSIGGSDATWQPWNYQKRLAMAKKVEKFKRKLKDPDGKQRGEVTKFISANKSRQEFPPPLGKYVDCIKPEPLHNVNNGWQHWFKMCLTVAMQYTDANQLKASTSLSDLPNSCPLIQFCNCVKDSMKCGRLFKNFSRWFAEKRKKNIQFSYRFTGLESKRFSWYFGLLVNVLLNITSLAMSTKVKLHALAFSGLKLRDSASLFSRVEINREHLTKLKVCSQQYFNANTLLLEGANPTIWTIGYAIPYHAEQLFEDSGYGLGLNSMQEREAKHIKLASYFQNTCNVRKNERWWVVFHHEFVSFIWFRQLDLHSITYRSDSYVLKKVSEDHTMFCYCGVQKSNSSDKACSICMSTTMRLVQESTTEGKINTSLRELLANN